MLDRRLKALCVGVAIGLACSPAFAQGEFPTRNLTTMVGTSPGGGSDTMGRLVSQKLSEILGKPIVVENRPGASNTIAVDATAKAKPDGYTLFVGSSTPLSIAPHLIELHYDNLKDIQPVGLVTLVPNILVINKNMGIKTVAELVDFMKKNPNKIKYGSSGLGTTHVVLAEMFNMAAGVKSVHVPYPGSPQIHVDLMAGVINVVTDSAPGLLPHIKAGNMTPLAVTSQQRIADIPDVPTMAEAGYPDVVLDTMYGLYTTAKTPRPIVEKLNAALNKALADPDFKKRLIDFGGKIQPMTVAEFEAFHVKEFERCGEIIRKADIKAKAN